MTGLEDKDYLLRQYSQIAKMLGNFANKETAEQIIHFDIKQEQTTNNRKKDDWFSSRFEKSQTKPWLMKESIVPRKNDYITIAND